MGQTRRYALADPIVSTATTDRGVAVSPHHLATRAAIDVLGAGGNAADAAIAANAVLGVVLPTTCGVGGDLFAIVHEPERDRPLVLNASGRGGSGLDAETLRSAGHRSIPERSPWSITVPGCVDGWLALGERCGTLPMPELLAAAISHAERGFQTSQELADALERLHPAIETQPSAEELYPEGRIPLRGEATFRPDYAEVLRGIAEHGRDGFYRGPVADAVVDAAAGALSADDLAVSQADWTEPIGVDLFGLRAWTAPPNSQGYLTLAACWLFGRLDPPPDPDDPAFHHAVVEAYRAVAWERDDLVADADHAPLEPGRLLDPARLGAPARRLDPERTVSWPPACGADGGTAYLCVVDGAGMAVSLIQSNYTGIGSGLSAGATGIWLHNRGAGFSLRPGHPNEAAPRKRPLHTLAPTLWTRDGQAALLLGTRGGHQQPQYLAQMAALLAHVGLEPAAAQLAPRWQIDAETPDPAVVVEQRMPAGVVEGLRSRGHRVAIAPDWQRGWGPVSVISIDAAGHRSAAADPRISTATAAGQ